MNAFLEKLQVALPIFQAPMAGVSTPAMAAAVSNAGGLGALGGGNLTPAAVAHAISETRQRTSHPFNVNFFCHERAVRDEAKEAAWLEVLTPFFRKFSGVAPRQLQEIYYPFQEDETMTQVVLELKPPVVSFHFGFPGTEVITALKAAGITLFATATSLDEARTACLAGIDAVVAQGIEAGGHRGIFDAEGADEKLAVRPLVERLAKVLPVPVIAAGGLMNGGDIAEVMRLGASAAQLGTAFIACDESAAEPAHKKALFSGRPSVLTSAISGRPARCIANRFTELGSTIGPGRVPSYPVAFDAAKALHAAAKAAGEHGFGAAWAGEGAAKSRAMPAGKLVSLLAQEFRESAFS